MHIFLRLDRSERSSIQDLKEIKVAGRHGNLVSLGELVRVEETLEDKSIYHKNLMPVVYVTADVAGRKESPAYVMAQLMDKVARLQLPEGYALEQYSTRQPFSAERYSVK